MNITTSLRRQRGCNYCADMIPWQKKPHRRSKCPYDVCPYHQLDGVKSYTDYLKSIGANNITQLLMAAGLKRYLHQNK